VSETQLAITIKAGPDYALRVEQFLGQIRAIIIPFGRDHLSFFFDAFRQYGKGRHPARLNMGDCFTYAVAKATGLPLLFVGDDFKKTDLTPA
jgi:ribonuclease VapC